MSTAADVIAYGKTFMGRPYVFGASGPGTFDCSGLMQYVFHHFGINLPRTSQQQAKVGASVAVGGIQAGDLVFSDWGDGPNSHVGLAVDHTHLLNAPHTGAVVRIDTLNAGYLAHVTNVRRVSEVGGVLATDAGGVAGAAGDAVGGVAGGIVGPLVQPLRDLAGAAQSGAKVADLITKAFLPTNFMRISAGMAGMAFVLIGILLLTREVRG